MADVFLKGDVRTLIRGKHILLIGDSNIRALYKDFVWLYNFNSLIGLRSLKRRGRKLEDSFLGDKLVDHSQVTRGRDFTEHRLFEDRGIKIEFLFVTKCYCNKLIKLLSDIKNGIKHCPDVILMNSCLWDVSRWGPTSVSDYKANMVRLMKLLSTSLPTSVLFIWATALPIAALTSGGLLIKQLDFLQASLRIHVIEANAFTAGLVSLYGFDVLDFHHHMRYQIIRRSSDGVHFLPPAMRFLTNLLLTHISLSWDVKLPGNLTSALTANIEKAIEASKGYEVKQTLKKIEQLAENLNQPNSAGVSERLNKLRNNGNKRGKTRATNCSNQTSESLLYKTPLCYYKATSARNKSKPNCQNNKNMQHNRNWKHRMNYEGNSCIRQKNDNIPQRTFQNNQPSNTDYNNSPFYQRDMRLVRFNNFNQSSSSTKSYNITVGNVQPSYDNIYSNRNHIQGYSDSSYMYQPWSNKYQSHPYQWRRNEGWQAWNECEIYSKARYMRQCRRVTRYHPGY